MEVLINTRITLLLMFSSARAEALYFFYVELLRSRGVSVIKITFHKTANIFSG